MRTAEWPERLKACVEAQGGHLSDIITNENLKLLQINYLAQKVDGLFNFPSRPHCTCNRTYAKTRYIPEGGISIVRAVGRHTPALLLRLPSTFHISFLHN